MDTMNIQLLVKTGAIVSSFGTSLLIIFAIILLTFSVTKDCSNQINDSLDCDYISNAPKPIDLIIQPIFLVVSLIIISFGIFMIRFGRWRENQYTYKKLNTDN